MVTGMYSYETYASAKSKEVKENSKVRGNVGYFKLVDDGDEALVRFVYDDPKELVMAHVHDEPVGNNKHRRVLCLRNGARDDMTKCPLCARGDKFFAKVYLKLVDSDFEAKLYNMLEKDLIAKKEFLESFEDKNFTMNCVKVKDQMFYCVLEHNLKFSKLYSDYAISKVFNSKSINEQKLFVTYPLAAVRALQDIIKGNFTKIYIVDYVFSLASKPKKNERLLKYINNDIIKEKLVLKLSYEDFLSNKEKVYELTRNGFKVALKIDKTFEFNEENIKLLKLFAFMVTDDEQIYDKVKVNYDIIYIPNS